MGNKLYVGNLAYTVRDQDLQDAFSQFGAVSSAKVMMDRDTGRSKGFGFVEMGTDAEAQAAVNGMNGQSLSGRAIVVNEARPREERPAGEKRSFRSADKKPGERKEYSKPKRDGDRKEGKPKFKERDGGKDRERDTREPRVIASASAASGESPFSILQQLKTTKNG